MTTTLVALAVALSLGGAHGHSQDGSPVSCSVRISGVEQADLLPSHLAWESVFDKFERPGIPGFTQGRAGKAVFDRVRDRLSAAHGKLVGIRSNPDAQLRQLEATTILDARDDLVRLLPPELFGLFESEAAANQSSVVFGTPALGVMKHGQCEAIARGRDYPELVPEAAYWQLYFRARAVGAAKHRVGADQYSDEHIRAVQNALPISAEDIRRLLNKSIAVNETLESMSAALAPRAAVRDVVLKARADLIRLFPPAVWQEINKHAARTRGGMVVMYTKVE